LSICSSDWWPPSGPTGTINRPPGFSWAINYQFKNVFIWKFRWFVKQILFLSPHKAKLEQQPQREWRQKDLLQGNPCVHLQLNFKEIDNIFLNFYVYYHLWFILPNSSIRFECRRLCPTLSLLTLSKDISTRPLIWSIPITRPFSPI
jgi:hypothetical protein